MLTSKLMKGFTPSTTKQFQQILHIAFIGIKLYTQTNIVGIDKSLHIGDLYS